MRKWIGWGVVFGVVLAAGGWRLAALNSKWQAEQRIIQVGVLNSAFRRVQPEWDKVLFLPSPGSQFMLAEDGRAGDSFVMEYSPFTKPARLAVDSQFSSDKNVTVRYTVEKIEEDGVTIGYRKPRGLFNIDRTFSGSIKLKWK